MKKLFEGVSIFLKYGLMLIGFLFVAFVLWLSTGFNLFAPFTWLSSGFDWLNGIVDKALYFAYDYEKFGFWAFWWRIIIIIAVIKFVLTEIVNSIDWVIVRVGRKQGESKI